MLADTLVLSLLLGEVMLANNALPHRAHHAQRHHRVCPVLWANCTAFRILHHSPFLNGNFQEQVLYFLWQFSFADLVYDEVLGSHGFNNEPMVFIGTMCTWGGIRSVGPPGVLVS